MNHVNLLKHTDDVRLEDNRNYTGKPGTYSLIVLLQCAGDGKSVIFDDRSSDGKNIQLLVWRIAVNPVTGVAAVMDEDNYSECPWCAWRVEHYIRIKYIL